MRIGIDCHVLTGKFQGSRTYLINLYKSLLDIDIANEYLFFGHWNEYAPFGDKVQYIDYGSYSRLKRLTHKANYLLEQSGIEVFHSQYIAPIILSCKSLLTIHDILFETHPQYFARTQLLRNKIFIRYSAQKAQQVHTVSQYSRQALTNIYGFGKDQIKVIPNGVDLLKFSPSDSSKPYLKISKKFNVKDYILSVGRIEPRKNYIGLLRAYSLLRENLENTGPLVIVGQRDFGYKEFFKMLSDYKLEDHVLILQSVDDDVLPDIYRAARLFVYPSFAEGFGIPPLEAMASGIPIITSNTTAIPEVVGNAGILVDPYAPEDIAEAMFKVLSDQSLSNQLSIKGRKQAEKWSWLNSAQRYLDAVKILQ